MSYTLFQATLDLSRIVQKTIEGTATGGSTTTLIDTTLLGVYPVDHFNAGALWMKSGLNANLTRVITNFDDTSATLTFAAFASVVAAGDTYALAYPRIALYKLREAINQAIAELIEVEAEDESLTTVDDQEEYTIPAGKTNVLRVEIAQALSSPWTWQRNYHWEETRAGKIRFDENFFPVGGYKIRFMYATNPAELTTDAGLVPAPLDQNGYKQSLLWSAAVIALRDRQKVIEGNDPLLTNQLNEAIQRADYWMRKYTVPPLVRDPHMGRW